MKTLNEVYSSLSARRRYEVWFVRLGMADGSGAWWFRYLLLNPGRDGCLHVGPAKSELGVDRQDFRAMPIQVWATWFPREGKPQSFIQGFPLTDLDLSARGRSPFHLIIGDNAIEENSCRGALDVGGHRLGWDLRYGSTFGATLSNKGWIGFSRTPHSDAVFWGHVTLDGHRFEGHPLGYGLQGHNCGYRHRGFWTWAHAFFPRADGPPSTLEALIYDMPLGLVFRKAVFCHRGKRHVFKNLRPTANSFSSDPPAYKSDTSNDFRWVFRCSSKRSFMLDVLIEGGGPSVHRLPYFKTDCSGSFEVVNNSLAKALVRLERGGGTPTEELESSTGAVLERAGAYEGGLDRPFTLSKGR